MCGWELVRRLLCSPVLRAPSTGPGIIRSYSSFTASQFIMKVNHACDRELSQQLLLRIYDTLLVAPEASGYIEIPEASYKGKALVHACCTRLQKEKARKESDLFSG